MRPVELTLSRTQARVILALARDRQRIIDEANRQIQEIEETLRELAEEWASGWPEGEGTPVFEMRGEEIVLVRKAPETGSAQNG